MCGNGHGGASVGRSCYADRDSQEWSASEDGTRTHMHTHVHTFPCSPVLHEDEQNGAPAAQGRGRSHGRDPAL